MLTQINKMNKCTTRPVIAKKERTFPPSPTDGLSQNLLQEVMQVPVLKKLLNGIKAAIPQQIKQLCSSLICRLACQQHPAHCQGKGIIRGAPRPCPCLRSVTPLSQPSSTHLAQHQATLSCLNQHSLSALAVTRHMSKAFKHSKSRCCSDRANLPTIVQTKRLLAVRSDAVTCS